MAACFTRVSLGAVVVPNKGARYNEYVARSEKLRSVCDVFATRVFGGATRPTTW
jgi:hypothetical protein